MELLKKKIPVSFLMALFLNLGFAALSQVVLKPGKLTCEYRVNPLGIDMAKPELSWTLVSGKRNQQQSAYELLVSDNRNDILHLQGNVWQTGKIESDQSLHIKYEGKPLTSFTRYFWSVRTYDQNGNVSPWSESQWFETAMLHPSDWQATWIGDGSKQVTKEEDFYKDDPMPLFRKRFDTREKVASARLYICGLGYYEAYINGEKIGDHMLDPGWTDYHKQDLYAVYDITKYLRQGTNVAGVMLGNGWYNVLPLRMWGSHDLRKALATGRPCLKAQLRITYADGTVTTAGTDETWQTMPGPVLRNSVYLGEHYDARLEHQGWSAPSETPGKFNNLKNAVAVEGPSGRLTAQIQPPIKVTMVVHPIRVTEPAPGVYVFDMGQNFAGVARIHVHGPAGNAVTLRYAEDKYADGNINVMTSVAGQIKSGNGGPGAPKIAWQEDNYTLKGKGVESWSPRFTFHGFRYVEVTGWPGKPSLMDIEGLRMNADVDETGAFTSSNTMFNKVFENIQWTFKSNIFSVQSDCPAREKFGYGGDMFCTAESFIYNFNMADFYRKVLQDYADDQRPLGGFTETTPYVGIGDSGPGDSSGPLGFQIGFSYVIKQLYDFYGDKQVIAKYYDAFNRQVKFLQDSANNYLYNADLGDHETLDAKSVGLTASVFYYHHVKLIAAFAAILQKKSDAEMYSALAEEIKKAILHKYFSAGTGQFDNGTQSAQAFGLWYGMVEGNEKEKAFNLLMDNIQKHNGHLSTGIFGTKMLLDVLSSNNRNDIAYGIANQRDFPGWGYMIVHGATTLWETWAYSDNMYSQNHPMFGSLCEWFYRSLLGINAGAPGFKKIIIKPQPAGNLTSAKGSYNSIHGRIASSWQIGGNQFQLDVEIPANTTAVIWVPIGNNEKITESGKPMQESSGLKLLRVEDKYAVIETGSGNYHFKTSYHY
ncbi:MAG: family 78 glycoside hydrolase catalytic domain [Ginsengibacter sp.]